MDLAALKRKHRFIFCTEFTEKLIYWRPLTIREHDIYSKIIRLELVPQGKLEDSIFREIILDPSVIDGMNQTPAGLVPSIVNTALSISGNLLLTEQDMSLMNNDIVEMRNAVTANPYEQFFILVCKAFPRYTPSDLEQLEYQELLRLVVMAEQLIGLEEPVSLKPAKEEKSLTDKLFKDKKQAEHVDYGAPSARNLKDILHERQEPDLATKQARQIEMENRFRQMKQS